MCIHIHLEAKININIVERSFYILLSTCDDVSPMDHRVQPKTEMNVGPAVIPKNKLGPGHERTRWSLIEAQFVRCFVFSLKLGRN